MLFAGLDVHKDETEVAIINEAGELLLRERIPTTCQALAAFAGKHLSDCRVALEATTNCWAVARILQPLCQDSVHASPS